MISNHFFYNSITGETSAYLRVNGKTGGHDMQYAKKKNMHVFLICNKVGGISSQPVAFLVCSLFNREVNITT